MTKNSPRIYVYKITFEEVSHYYYGVHKEKKFDEYYMGTPISNRWMWDFYTPKKQILEFFEYSNSGWKDANRVEQRIIKMFFNDDIYCLNENCAGVASLKYLSIAGKKGGSNTYKLKAGMFSLTKDEHIKNCKKGTQTQKDKKIGIFGATSQELSEWSKKGNLKITKDDKIKYGKIGGKISGDRCKELSIGICGLTKEQRQEIAKKTNSQKWKCNITGYISTPSGLACYQKARGIDKSERTRIE